MGAKKEETVKENILETGSIGVERVPRYVLLPSTPGVGGSTEKHASPLIACFHYDTIMPKKDKKNQKPSYKVGLWFSLSLCVVMVNV